MSGLLDALVQEEGRVSSADKSTEQCVWSGDRK